MYKKSIYILLVLVFLTMCNGSAELQQQYKKHMATIESLKKKYPSLKSYLSKFQNKLQKKWKNAHKVKDHFKVYGTCDTILNGLKMKAIEKNTKIAFDLHDNSKLKNKKLKMNYFKKKNQNAFMVKIQNLQTKKEFINEWKKITQAKDDTTKNRLLVSFVNKLGVAYKEMIIQEWNRARKQKNPQKVYKTCDSILANLPDYPEKKKHIKFWNKVKKKSFYKDINDVRNEILKDIYDNIFYNQITSFEERTVRIKKLFSLVSIKLQKDENKSLSYLQKEIKKAKKIADSAKGKLNRSRPLTLQTAVATIISMNKRALQAEVMLNNANRIILEKKKKMEKKA